MQNYQDVFDKYRINIQVDNICDGFERRTLFAREEERVRRENVQARLKMMAEQREQRDKDSQRKRMEEEKRLAERARKMKQLAKTASKARDLKRQEAKSKADADMQQRIDKIKEKEHQVSLTHVFL